MSRAAACHGLNDSSVTALYQSSLGRFLRLRGSARNSGSPSAGAVASAEIAMSVMPNEDAGD